MTSIELQKLIEGHADAERRRILIDSQLDDYLARHPYQWLALAEGDVWVLSDTLEALVQELDIQGLSRGSAIIRFLNPDPVKLVL